MIENRIKAARMAAGLSCAELARKLGMYPATLGRIERGERGLRSDLAVRIADVCGCSLDALLGYERIKDETLVKDDETNPLPILGRENRGIGIVMARTGATIPRPGIVAGVADAYGFDMPDDSMSPRYDAGEVLIVDPSRTAKVGDYVIYGTVIDGQELGSVHRLTRRNKSEVTLSSLQPADARQVALSKVTRLDVVVGSFASR